VDEERTALIFNNLLDDKICKAIICVLMSGYGIARIIDKLNFQPLL
jgi:hypothetical protein